jgi:hypothetical protein
LANLGFTLTFVDSNAENFWSAVTPMTRTLLTNSVVWGLALTVAMVLAAALYLWQRRKEYAISRALGMPIKRVNKHDAASDAADGVNRNTDWRRAVMALCDSAGTADACLHRSSGRRNTDGNHFTRLDDCALGRCVLRFALLPFIGTWIVAHTPVLNLLQGEQGRTRKASNKPDLADASRSVGRESAEKDEMSQPALHENKKAVASRVARFIFRNCCRSGIKLILGIGVACLFTCALLWLAMTISQSRVEIDRLYDTTVVEAEIVKQIPSMTAKGTGGGIIKGGTVDEILASGAIESDYLEGAAEWTGIAAEGSALAADETGSITLLAFDQPEEFFADGGAKANIEYADGWDADLFHTKLVAGESSNGCSGRAVQRHDAGAESIIARYRQPLWRQQRRSRDQRRDCGRVHRHDPDAGHFRAYPDAAVPAGND